MSPLFAPTPDSLSSLDPREAVRTFRDLLWAQARRRGFPITSVHVSERIDVADGGVDAEVDADAVTGVGADELLDRGTATRPTSG